MIAIVGAGLAGLAAARRLVQSGFTDFVILERSSRAGGRVDTRIIEGFRLDAGFHVASTAYRAFRSFLPIATLEPAWFDAGVLLQKPSGELFPLYHPLRHPTLSQQAGWPPIALADLCRLGILGVEALSRPGEAWAKTHRENSAALLLSRRFSEDIMDSFFRPFFGGVFLDEDLQTSAGLLRYYLRNFILGRAFLPSGGIGRLASTLRREIPDEHFRFQCTVREVQPSADGFRLALKSGEILSASQVVLANGPAACCRLLSWPEPAMRATTTLYFRSRKAVYPERCLVLPRGKRPLVRHFLQLTNIDPCLAPAGEHLLSATVLDSHGFDDPTLFQIALQEIGGVMPGAAGLLQPFQAVHVPAALPVQTPQNLVAWMQRRENLPPGLFLAGDLAGNASQHNALESGVESAEGALACAGHVSSNEWRNLRNQTL